MDIKKELAAMTKEKAILQLSKKYSCLLTKLFQGGCYIWGTGLLGKFAKQQCDKNDIFVRGFIDNNVVKQNEQEHVFSGDILKEDDVIILASLYYPDIAEQLQSAGVHNYIFYEELAFILENMDTYSSTFEDLFGEIEANKTHYQNVYELLTDKLSKEIYANLMMFRCTLDIKYVKRARELSTAEGHQDFDRVVLEKLDSEYTFFDVGGFDGESTLEYIAHANQYRKIYFFEPDKAIIENAKKRLENKENIEFIQAGVGAKKGIENYDAIGNGSGAFLEGGQEKIAMVALDDFVDDTKSYIKMDIEGYELQALKGAEQCIRRYKPILSISVYHLPGDIHRLIHLILSWNPTYKVYMRHYTNSYIDTRVYFVEGEV